MVRRHDQKAVRRPPPILGLKRRSSRITGLPHFPHCCRKMLQQFQTKAPPARDSAPDRKQSPFSEVPQEVHRFVAQQASVRVAPYQGPEKTALLCIGGSEGFENRRVLPARQINRLLARAKASAPFRSVSSGVVARTRAVCRSTGRASGCRRSASRQWARASAVLSLPDVEDNAQIVMGIGQIGVNLQRLLKTGA